MRNNYDQIAERWHARTRSRADVGRLLGYLDRILEGLPPGSRVLDLGCGTGEPIAAHVVRRGFRVVCVDQSAKMLEIARRTVPQAQLIHADMTEASLDGKFAAAVAWDSVFHVERKRHAAIYRKLADALEVGGRLLTSVGGSDAGAQAEGSTGESARAEGSTGGDASAGGSKGAEGFTSEGARAEGFTSEMFGHTFFYSGYAPTVARSLIERAGFEIELFELDDPSSRGHIAVVARRVERARVR